MKRGHATSMRRLLLQALLHTCLATHFGAPCRYKIVWTVNSNVDGNSESLLSEFFYVGAWVGPAGLRHTNMSAAHRLRSPFAALSAQGRLPPSPALKTARHPPAAGLPDIPGTPTLTNERNPTKLKVVFATPTVDNAGRLMGLMR